MALARIGDAPSAARVRKPRHFLLYRALTPQSAGVGRVLHEAMDLPKHIPPTYLMSVRIMANV
jgi:plasmid stabilization system protein ParE